MVNLRDEKGENKKKKVCLHTLIIKKKKTQ